MNFELTDDQQEIKRTAHELLAGRATPEKVREAAEAGRYDDALWRELAELGWPGIAVPEEHGGQGLGYVELQALRAGPPPPPPPPPGGGGGGGAEQTKNTPPPNGKKAGVASQARDGRGGG